MGVSQTFNEPTVAVAGISIRRSGTLSDLIRSFIESKNKGMSEPSMINNLIVISDVPNNLFTGFLPLQPLEGSGGTC